MKRTDPQMRIRLPEDVKSWLERQAEKNVRTQNAEIVVALRDRMAAGRDDHVSDSAPRTCRVPADNETATSEPASSN